MALSAWEEAVREEVPEGKPWDDRPPTESQVGYAQELVRRLHEEADWTSLYRAAMSEALRDLFAIHKRLGLPWVDITGMDAARHR